MGEHELAAIRMGRFRICPPNAPGPPETSHGRFRISTQGNVYYEIPFFFKLIKTISIHKTGAYGPASPCLQRGRFAVIPEEPSSAAVTDSQINNGSKRAPSPDWDFTTEVNEL